MKRSINKKGFTLIELIIVIIIIAIIAAIAIPAVSKYVSEAEEAAAVANISLIDRGLNTALAKYPLPKDMGVVIPTEKDTTEKKELIRELEIILNDNFVDDYEIKVEHDGSYVINFKRYSHTDDKFLYTYNYSSTTGEIKKNGIKLE